MSRAAAVVRRVPAPLALLLVVVAIFGTAWVVLVPPWGGPDEDSHFAYAQTLGELGRLPGGAGLAVSGQQRNSMDFVNSDATVIFHYAKPTWSGATERRWRIADRLADRRNGGGGNAAAAYPPAYYLIESLPYRALGKTDVMTDLYVMRLVSALWLLVATVGAWLLAGEVFGRNRALQLVTAASVGLWPMVAFVCGVLNPDAMLIGLSSLTTWLGVSLLRRGPSAARAIALALCIGLALATKATALAWLPPLAFAMAITAWRLRRRISVRRVLAVAAVVLAFALPVGAWVSYAHDHGRTAYAQATLVGSAPTSAGAPGSTSGNGGVRQFASYLWQFYLPKLPFQHPKIHFVDPHISTFPVFHVWLASGWASFGWVNVWFGTWVYYLFLAIAILIVAGAAITAVKAWPWRIRRAPWLAPTAFMALFAVSLLGGLHRTDFHMYLDNDPPFLQGRYLLPIAPILALFVAQATRALPRRWRPAGAGAVLAGLVVFQLACLGLILYRYYDV